MPNAIPAKGWTSEEVLNALREKRVAEESSPVGEAEKGNVLLD